MQQNCSGRDRMNMHLLTQTCINFLSKTAERPDDITKIFAICEMNRP